MVPTVAELLSLIDEVETVETKNKLAACLNTILDRARAEVLSFQRFIHSDLLNRRTDFSLGLFDYLCFSTTL